MRKREGYRDGERERRREVIHHLVERTPKAVLALLLVFPPLPQVYAQLTVVLNYCACEREYTSCATLTPTMTLEPFASASATLLVSVQRICTYFSVPAVFKGISECCCALNDCIDGTGCMFLVASTLVI